MRQKASGIGFSLARLALGLVLLADTASYSAPVGAGTVPVVARHVNIVWGEGAPKPKRKTKLTKAEMVRLRRSCVALGKALSPKIGVGGFHGYGLFRTFSCYEAASGKRVFGKKRPSPWLFRIEAKSKAVKIEGIYTPPVRGKTRPLSVANLDFPVASTLDFHERMRRTDLARFLALTLLDQLPIAAQVGRGNWLRGKWLPLFEIKGVPPPKELVAYTLAFEPATGLWRSEVKGTLKLQKPPGSVQDAAEEKGGSTGEAWVLGEGDAPVNGDALFIHSREGPGEAKDRHEKALAAVLKEPLPDLNRPGPGVLATIGDKRTLTSLATVATGKAVVDSEALLLPGAALWRASLIMRGRPLWNPVLELDLLPTVRESFLESTYKIGWTRVMGGVEFGMDPGWGADWIAVTPKLGSWRLDAVLPIKGEDDVPIPVDYSFKTQTAIGYRVAAEFATPIWTAFRLTQGREVTSAFLSPGGGASGAQIESYGLEVYFRGINLGVTLFPYMLLSREFAIYSLGKTSELELLDTKGFEDASGAKQTYFDTDFIGIGIGAAW